MWGLNELIHVEHFEHRLAHNMLKLMNVCSNNWKLLGAHDVCTMQETPKIRLSKDMQMI